MKKRCFLLLFLLFLLPSCIDSGVRETSIRDQLTYPVSITATVLEENGLQPITFRVYCFDTEAIVGFLSPDTLQPLRVHRKEETLTAFYEGIETTLNNDALDRILALERAVAVIHGSTDCEKSRVGDDTLLLFTLDGDSALVYYNNQEKRVYKIKSEADGSAFTYEISATESIETWQADELKQELN